MKIDKGFVLVVGLITGAILAVGGNVFGYGIIAGIVLTQACLSINDTAK